MTFLVQPLEKALLPEVTRKVPGSIKRAEVFGIASPRYSREALILTEAINLIECECIQKIRGMRRYENLAASVGVIPELFGEFGKQFGIKLVLGLFNSK